MLDLGGCLFISYDGRAQVNGMLGGDGVVLNSGFMRCMRLIKLAKILRFSRDCIHTH